MTFERDSAGPLGSEASVPPELVAFIARKTVDGLNAEYAPLRQAAGERVRIGLALFLWGVLAGLAAAVLAFLFGTAAA